MSSTAATGTLSLYHLLDPEVLANPYPLYERLRREDPVHWDPYLHAWIVTRYEDVADVLLRFRAARTPTPDRMAELGMEQLAPVAKVMVRQMLFLDQPDHGRVRRLASVAFTPRRVERLRTHVDEIARRLLDQLASGDRVELMEGFANPFPAIVTAELLGVPPEDHQRLKLWSRDFAEMLGNFQHNPGRRWLITSSSPFAMNRSTPPAA
jgi:cytochrome P450